MVIPYNPQPELNTAITAQAAQAMAAPDGAPSDWWSMMLTLQVLGAVYGLTEAQTGFLMAFYPIAPNLVKQAVGLPSKPGQYQQEWANINEVNRALEASSEPAGGIVENLAAMVGAPASVLAPLKDPSMLATWDAIIDRVYATRKQWADASATPEAKAEYDAKVAQVVNDLNAKAMGVASAKSFSDAVAKLDARGATDWGAIAKWGGLGLAALLVLMMWRPWK